MLEWLKRHAWKACKLQKGFRGSNPRLSARLSGFESPSLRKTLTRFVCPSLLEQANIGKGLYRMPVADCGDYEGIPGEDASGRLWGLRRNPRLSARLKKRKTEKHY